VGSPFGALQSRNFRLWGLRLARLQYRDVDAADGPGLARPDPADPPLRAATSITVGLQFLPLLLFSPYAGAVADRLHKGRILLVSQSVLGLGVLVLSLLVVTGTVQLWQVF
jgi:MFS family permease